MIKLVFSALFYFLLLFNNSAANEKIVFIDIDQIIYNSDLGKKIAKKMDADFKKKETNLIKIEKDLKKREDELIKQKNILSEEELNKKIKSLRNEINEFKTEKNSLINSFQQEKLKKVNLMVDKLNRILSVYAADESIDIIVQKKNIVIGKSDLDITEKILKIFNKQVTKLDN
tara:strand:- start:578 stop:1096 length:519 start_codon:yes stop_codon:yes gene_type:complete